MQIGGLDKTSLIDYPGKIAAVVFTQGCNWRCPFCHNPELVMPRCFRKPIPEEEVMQFLEKRVNQLDGVVISGGEPTFHSDLPGFAAAIKDLGYLVKLDTNGTNPEMLRVMLSEGLVDYVAMDLKGPVANYQQLAGARVDPEVLRTSIWMIKNSGIDHEFRTTVVPGLHTLRELKAMGELVRGAQRYALQDFVSDHCLRESLRGRPAFPYKTLNKLRPFMERRVKIFEIRSNESAVPMPNGRGTPLDELDDDDDDFLE
ncbi:MAG: anaerobic ribonucleoside-triphosphate reductase activating protein [Verrucomicrobiota bacterium JB022]|nr:anaerobic ribonucleoside-triphosphate reductase activating protein [Verrucomicrobiota bacterium JB022]